MATISEMRLYLMSRYPYSLKWHKRVVDMPTRQVVAIYKKMKKRILCILIMILATIRSTCLSI